jgi:plastocyanin
VTTAIETSAATQTATGTTGTTVTTTAQAGEETTVGATLTPTVIATATPTTSGTEYIEQDSGLIPNFTYYPGTSAPAVTTVPTSVPNTTGTTLMPNTTVTTPAPVTNATTPVPTTMVMTTIPAVTTPPPTTVTTAPTVPTIPPTTPGSETIPLTAQNLAFSTSTITVRAGEEVMIAFNNMDAGVPHNFAVYTDSSASTPIFQGTIVTGPTTATYTFTAPGTPGNYFFRCDVHPEMMGIFVVT